MKAKKLCAALILGVSIVLSTLFGAACSSDGDAIKVYVPDGAPAIGMSYLFDGNLSYDRKTEYNVVNATVIQKYVTGENPEADVAVLPANAASKLLGSGEKYKMLGTLTHGNLFLVKRESSSPDVTSAQDFSLLKGKTVGVVNLANVPGLTFKTILSKNGIAYSELSGGVESDKVNLKAFSDASGITPATTDCDYFVLPEPAATGKTNATSMEIAGSLQTLYGGDKGYPQAVVVAKNSLIKENPDYLSAFVSSLSQSRDWLADESVTGEKIYSLIAERYGAQPSFAAAQLNKTVIANCAINFVPSKDCKEEVKEFLKDFISIDPSSASEVDDGFFYVGF